MSLTNQFDQIASDEEVQPFMQGPQVPAVPPTGKKKGWPRRGLAITVTLLLVTVAVVFVGYGGRATSAAAIDDVVELDEDDALCGKKLVEKACGQIADKDGATTVTPTQLARELATDEESVKAFLKHIELEESDELDCAKLCEQTVQKIPPKNKPEKAMWGGRIDKDGNVHWDVELRKFTIDLQNKLRMDANEPADDAAAAEERRLDDDPDVFHVVPMVYVDDAVTEVAKKFRIFPLQPALSMGQEDLQAAGPAAGEGAKPKDVQLPAGWKALGYIQALYGEAWIAGALENANWRTIPDAYEQFMGPSLAHPEEGSKAPCGPSCRSVRNRLALTSRYIHRIYLRAGAINGDDCDGTTFAQINPKGTTNKLSDFEAIYATSDAPFKAYRDPDCECAQKGDFGKSCKCKVRKSTNTNSERIDLKGGMKGIVVQVCGFWWNKCGAKLLKGDEKAFGQKVVRKACGNKGFGEGVGTLVHESMHHYPMNAIDYMYYRPDVKDFVKANEKPLNKPALDLAKHSADANEYLLETIWGVKNTGR